MAMTETTLLRLQFLGMLALVLILTLGLGTYFTLHQTHSYREESATLGSGDHPRRQQARLASSLDTLHDQLQQIRASTEAVLKRDIRQQVDQALQIAHAIHAREQGRRPEEGNPPADRRDLASAALLRRPRLLLHRRPGRQLRAAAHRPRARRQLAARQPRRQRPLHHARPARRGGQPQGAAALSRYRWYAPENPQAMADKIATCACSSRSAR